MNFITESSIKHVWSPLWLKIQLWANQVHQVQLGLTEQVATALQLVQTDFSFVTTVNSAMTMILKIKYVNSGLAIITKFSAVEPTSATQSLTFVNLEHVKMTHNFVQ